MAKVTAEIKAYNYESLDSHYRIYAIYKDGHTRGVCNVFHAEFADATVHQFTAVLTELNDETKALRAMISHSQLTIQAHAIALEQITSAIRTLQQHHPEPDQPFRYPTICAAPNCQLPSVPDQYLCLKHIKQGLQNLKNMHILLKKD